MRTRPKAGFTLIELSIALVIIGLLVGGVLSGRELLYTASIRATAKQAERYITAYNTFKLKYNCLPGDCASATNFGLYSIAFDQNGNGDGFIQICCGLPESREAINVFAHLKSSELIDDFQIPVGIINTYYAGLVSPKPMMKLVSGSDTGWTLNGVSTHLGNMNVLMLQHYDNFASGAVDVFSARSLDTKFDDSKPLSGKMQHNSTLHWNTAMDIASTVNEAVSAGGRGCIMPDGSGGYDYNLSAPTDLTMDEACRLWIRID
jgi:prepilin-type N-terminal cleavage/methylation domain-containing protein